MRTQMSYEVKVTRQGRTTIPKALRKKYKINEGDKIIYLDLGDHVAILPITEHTKAPLSEYATKGDANGILAFLKINGPLSEESAKNITDTSGKGKKSAIARKLDLLE